MNYVVRIHSTDTSLRTLIEVTKRSGISIQVAISKEFLFKLLFQTYVIVNNRFVHFAMLR